MVRLDPDERTIRGHLDGARFQAGVDRGDWRLASEEWSWPHPIIAVSASPRPHAPDEIALKFTVDGYPNSAPTAQPWDADAEAPLPVELWPTGGRVSAVFNPGWNPTALYLPCDRVAMNGHDGWRQQFPAIWWDPAKDIVDYLGEVHELLHSHGYTGLRQAA